MSRIKQKTEAALSKPKAQAKRGPLAPTYRTILFAWSVGVLCGVFLRR